MKLVLHDGEGQKFAEVELGDVADNNHTLNSGELPHGHLFIEVDGQPYGSLEFSKIFDAPFIELGQYDDRFDQWQPTNPITEAEEV